MDFNAVAANAHLKNALEKGELKEYLLGETRYQAIFSTRGGFPTFNEFYVISAICDNCSEEIIKDTFDIFENVLQNEIEDKKVVRVLREMKCYAENERFKKLPFKKDILRLLKEIEKLMENGKGESTNSLARDIDCIMVKNDLLKLLTEDDEKKKKVIDDGEER